MPSSWTGGCPAAHAGQRCCLEQEEVLLAPLGRVWADPGKGFWWGKAGGGVSTHIEVYMLLRYIQGTIKCPDLIYSLQYVLHTHGTATQNPTPLLANCPAPLF